MWSGRLCGFFCHFIAISHTIHIWQNSQAERSKRSSPGCKSTALIGTLDLLQKSNYTQKSNYNY